MSKKRGSRGSGEGKRALRAASSGHWENISTRKESKSNFAVVSGAGRKDCAPTDEVVDLHRAHNRAVDALRPLGLKVRLLP